MLYQTGGTIIAGQLALIHGWAINLGGVSIGHYIYHDSCAYIGHFIRAFTTHPVMTAEDSVSMQVSRNKTNI